MDSLFKFEESGYHCTEDRWNREGGWMGYGSRSVQLINKWSKGFERDREHGTGNE